MGPAKWGQTLHSHDRLACAFRRGAPTRAKKPASRERGRRPYLRREAPRFTRDAAEFESHAHWATKGSMMASRPKAKGAGAGGGLAQRASTAWGDCVHGAINWGKDARKVAIPKRHKIKAPPPAPTTMPRRLEKKPFRRLKGGLEGFSFDFSTRAQQLGQEAASTRPQCVPIIFPIRPNEGSIPPRPSEGSARSGHPGWGAPQAQAQPRRASPRRRGRTDWAKRASRVVMKKRHNIIMTRSRIQPPRRRRRSHAAPSRKAALSAFRWIFNHPGERPQLRRRQRF